MAEYIQDYATRSRIESVERELGDLKRKTDDDGSGSGGCFVALLFLAAFGFMIWWAANKPGWNREMIADCVKAGLGSQKQCYFWVHRSFEK